MSKQKQNQVVIHRDTFANGDFLDAKELNGKPQKFDDDVCKALVASGKAKWHESRSAAKGALKAGDPIGGGKEKA